MLQTLLHKFYRIVIMRLYTSDTVLLLRHDKVMQPSSAADIKKVDIDNVADASSFQSPIQIRLFRTFLARGDEGYYAYLNDRCVHRSWVVKGTAKISLHKFFSLQLTDQDIFIHYCETAPEARGKNIFTAVLSHIAGLHQQHRVLTSVDAANSASLKSMHKAGYVEIAAVHIRIIFGFKSVHINADRKSEIYELIERQV